MDGSTVPPRGPAIDASSAFILLITIFAFFLPILLYFPPVPPSKRDALLETHTQVGLSPSESGLKGHHSKANNSNGSDNNPTSKIRSLFIYPLKSCRGIEVRQSKVLPTGLEFDRLYTFAQLKSPFPLALPSPSQDQDQDKSTEKEKEAHTWHFITQRQFPLLATIQVDLFTPDPLKTRVVGTTPPPPPPPSASASASASAPFLLVRFPWRERGLRGLLGWAGAKLARGWRAQPEREFVLPVAYPTAEEIAARGYGEGEEVVVWRETVRALDMGVEVPEELALYLGVSNRLGLFRVDPGRLREVFRCAPRRGEVGYQPVTGFQDAYPLHLLNLTSVRDFEAKIEKDEALRELDPRRFRANIIVDGDDSPYDEETWKRIRFRPGPSSKRDASEFHVSCRTVRCKLPNVDQDTGSRHPMQPDRALRKFREVDEGAKHMGCLGMQVTPLFPKTSSSEDLESWVEVGMSVEVLERGEHVYIPQ